MFESFNDFTNNDMPLNEGMFSFKTLGDNKAISANSGADIYMFDDKGNMWHEQKYEGYGIFGGKDFFELMAEMNGEEGRDIGIDLYFSDNKKVLYPALTRDEDFNWKRHKFTTKIKSDPKQGAFYESTVTEEYRLQHGGSEFKQIDRMVKSSDKDAVGQALGKIFSSLYSDWDHDQIWAYVVSFMGGSKYRNMLESFNLTLDVNEAKSIAKIQKEWANVTIIMKDKVKEYKASKGQEKEDLLDELKSLTAAKKKLEAELDDAVGLKDMDAELAESMVSAKRGHKYYKLSKNVDVAYVSGSSGMGMEVPGVLIKTKTGHFEGQKDAYIVDYYGAYFYIDMDNKVAMPIESDKYQSKDFNKSLKPVDKAPEHSDWKDMVHESLNPIELVSESYDELNERVVTLKRRYTENYPAVTAGKSARIRNKMLEAIADGKITQEEYNAILKEMSNHPGKWTRRNSKYFNVSEEGISLSKFGKRALSQIAVNEEDMNEARENWIVYTGDAMKKFYSEHTGKKSAEKMVDMASRVLNTVDMMTKSEWEKEKKAGNVMENTKFIHESFAAFEANNIKTAGLNESVVTEGKHDAMLDQLAELVKDVDFMNVGIRLKKAGIKYDFSTGMMPMYKLDKHPIAIVNKKYVDKGDREVGDIAIGVLESVELNEDFKDVSDKFKKALDNLPDSKFNTKDIEALIKKHKEKRPDAAMAYTKKAFGWLMKESEELNEAFQSSKLRNLLTMRGADGSAIKNLAKAFYGLTKYKLDELPDAALRDVDPQTAYKSYQKDNEFAVFYIVDNEKGNPYGDRDWGGKIEPGIIAITRGKEFLGATYDSKKAPSTLTTAASDNAVGGNKKYSGYGATGIYNVKRAAELADRAIVVWLNNDVFKSNDQVKQRTEAKSGAIAFKSDVDFKKANMQRYNEILANKASKLPLDKMIEKAIDELSAQIKDGLSKGEKTRYGDILIGKNKKGNDVRMRDASNHMSNILDAYSKYVSYMEEEAQAKEDGYSSNFYAKEAKAYAKRLADDIKKIKSFDYAW